jgi:hypothetical protein
LTPHSSLFSRSETRPFPSRGETDSDSDPDSDPRGLTMHLSLYHPCCTFFLLRLYPRKRLLPALPPLSNLGVSEHASCLVLVLYTRYYRGGCSKQSKQESVYVCKSRARYVVLCVCMYVCMILRCRPCFIPIIFCTLSTQASKSTGQVKRPKNPARPRANQASKASLLTSLTLPPHHHHPPRPQNSPSIHPSRLASVISQNILL